MSTFIYTVSLSGVRQIYNESFCQSHETSGISFDTAAVMITAIFSISGTFSYNSANSDAESGENLF